MIYILNLKSLATTHHLHQIWIVVGHKYRKHQEKSPDYPYFHETLGGALKTCPLNFKVQKDVVGEEVISKRG